MEPFKFDDFSDVTEERCVFVNSICKLLYEKHNGNIFMAVSEGEKGLFSDIEENVRNVYQFIDSKIPLLAYYELHKYGADNYDFTPEEYKLSIDNSVKACHEYYK